MDIRHIEPQHIAPRADEGGHGGLCSAAVSVDGFLHVGARFTPEGELHFSLAVGHRFNNWFRGFDDLSPSHKIGTSVRDTLRRSLGQHGPAKASDDLFNFLGTCHWHGRSLSRGGVHQTIDQVGFGAGGRQILGLEEFHKFRFLHRLKGGLIDHRGLWFGLWQGLGGRRTTITSSLSSAAFSLSTAAFLNVFFGQVHRSGQLCMFFL
jgi:hypothetical protein